LTVSSKSIPTYANANDFAAWIMDKRVGLRAVYDETTDPKLSEINKRLLASEQAIEKEVRTSWKTRTATEESVWYEYNTPSYFYASKYNLLNRKEMPTTVTLVHHPIVAITSLKCMIDGTDTELIGNASYEEGWDHEYYIDYQNGFIFFRSFKPKFRTNIKIVYTYGYLENSGDGVTIDDTLTITGHTTVTSGDTITLSLQSTTNDYNGKLIEVTSGTADGRTYRILSSSYNSTSTITTLTLLAGYTSSSDGVSTSDTIKLMGVPADIQELVCIHCFLGIKSVDPTYAYNLAYPPEEPMIGSGLLDQLLNRYKQLIEYRKSNMSLLN